MDDEPNLISEETRTENKEHFQTYGQRKIMGWSEEQRQGIKGLTNVDQWTGKNKGWSQGQETRGRTIL